MNEMTLSPRFEDALPYACVPAAESGTGRGVPTLAASAMCRYARIIAIRIVARNEPTTSTNPQTTTLPQPRCRRTRANISTNVADKPSAKTKQTNSGGRQVRNRLLGALPTGQPVPGDE